MIKQKRTKKQDKRKLFDSVKKTQFTNDTNHATFLASPKSNNHETPSNFKSIMKDSHFKGHTDFGKLRSHNSALPLRSYTQ